MIPTFNSAKTIALAIKSLLYQSHPNWEALVVDDGSTDDTEVAVRKFNDPRIRYYKLPSNQGRAFARQFALDHASGDFLTMLDSDDWLMPNKFEKQLKFLKIHPDVGLVSTSMYLSKSNGTLQSVISYKEGVYPALNKVQALPIPHAPIMIRMDLVKGRKYDTNLKYSEDLDFFLPLLLKNKFGVIAQPLYVYLFEDNKNFHKIYSQLSSHRIIFKKHKALLKVVLTYPKILLYWILFRIGLQRMISERSFQSPNLSDETVYDEARATL